MLIEKQTVKARLRRCQMERKTVLVTGLEAMCISFYQTNKSSFSLCPEVLQVTETKGHGLIYLVEEISRHTIFRL